MDGKTPKDMEFWTKGMVVEFDKFQINQELLSIDVNYNIEETSWNPSIVQRFIGAVNQVFLSKFPYKGKLSWDVKKVKGVPVVEASIRTNDYGVLAVQLPVEKIRSPKCPKSLPVKLIENFINQFEKKATKSNK